MPGIYKIGVVTQKTGLSASTLRLWEEQYGLLAPVRTSGGTRLYSQSDVERILYVRHLVRDRGYALSAIADIIDEAASRLPYTLDRVALENIYLRDATNHSDIEQGRRMARVQAIVRDLIHAESAQRAAVTLVAGVKALTGAHSAGLGIYYCKTYTIVPVVAASGGTIPTSPRIPPFEIARFPREWQQAIDAHQPYASTDLLRLDLPGEVNSHVIKHRSRSFHAEPLTIANELVGVLTIASLRADGVGHEAEQVIEGLALAAGPAIHYFAQHLDPGPSLQPRL
jgi:DNA-binding transcriptional MerR regulator